MLVFLALSLTVLVGLMGLSVDYGFVALERRSLQAAADAAAMSGALDLPDPANWGSINTDVNTMVGRNVSTTGLTITCTLVNNSNTQVQANCDPPTDNTTSGVR